MSTISSIESIGNNELKNSLGLISPPKQSENFSDFMNNTIQRLNEISVHSDNLSTRFAAGENVELHDVMIASQEKEIALSLTLKLRNKALEIYSEVMKMAI